MMKLALFFVSFLLLTSCWPTSVGFKDGSIDPSWKYFSVETIKSEAANAPLNYAPLLTEELKDEIQNRTGLKLNTGNHESQINITGNVIGYEIAPVAIQGNDNASKNRLTITAMFDIFITSPEEDMMQVRASRFADYDATQDLGSIETNLYEEVNRQIIQDVINELLSNW